MDGRTILIDKQPSGPHVTNHCGNFFSAAEIITLTAKQHLPLPFSPQQNQVES